MMNRLERDFGTTAALEVAGTDTFIVSIVRQIRDLRHRSHSEISCGHKIDATYPRDLFTRRGTYSYLR